MSFASIRVTSTLGDVSGDKGPMRPWAPSYLG